MGDVAGMVGMRLMRDAKASGQKTCAGLGDHFLGRILVVTEPAGQVTVEPRRRAAPMGDLVPETAIEILGARATVGVEKAGLVRHVDGIG